MNASEIYLIVNGQSTTLQMVMSDVLADIQLIKNSMADVSLTAANMDVQLSSALNKLDKAVLDSQNAADQNTNELENLKVAVEGMQLAVADVQQVNEQHGLDISTLSNSLQGIEQRVSNLEIVESAAEASPNDMSLQ